MNNHIRGYFHAIISSATFGLIPLLAIPIMRQGMSNASILFYRFLFSAIAMAVIVLIKKQSFRISTRGIVVSFALGIMYAATSLLLLQAYSMIPSGIATTIHFLYPLMVSVLMILFFREKASLSLVGAMILSLCGVGLLSWNDSGSLAPAGIMVALCSIFTYATYIVGVQKSGAKNINEYTLTFYILLFSGIFFFINALTRGGIEPVADASGWINLLLLALLPTVISDLSLILAIKYIGSTTTAILGCMEPLTSVIIGVAVFNEPFGIKIITGIMLVLGAVIIVIRAGAKPSVQKAQ